MKQVIAMQKQKGDVEIEGTLHRLSLPKGCKDVELTEIKNSPPEK